MKALPNSKLGWAVAKRSKDLQASFQLLALWLHHIWLGGQHFDAGQPPNIDSKVHHLVVDKAKAVLHAC